MINDQKLYNNRGSADYGQIHVAYKIQDTQRSFDERSGSSYFIMSGADDRNQETEYDTDQNGKKRNPQGNAKTVNQVFPAIVLDKVQVERIFKFY